VTRVLVAPQEFKGSLSADEAADAIAKGIRRRHPDWEIDTLPMSDGGPGLLDALRRAVKADTAAAVVQDPLGRRVLGRYIRLRESGDVVIEAAQANGLWHVTPNERDPLYSDTAGVGELIADALNVPTKRIIVGVGGSATTDGGAGMAIALGARFSDAAGEPLAPGGAPLAELVRIDWQRPTFADGVEFLVATDVTNPLLGPNGAAAVYAPQKGASAAQVDILEAALHRYAAVVRRSLGVDISQLPGGGAAGGLAAGLVAFLGARIESGFDLVASTVHLQERLARADLIVTGEGNFDGQSLQGKVTGRIVEMAAKAGKRTVVFAGRISSPPPRVPGGTTVRALLELEPDAATAMRMAGKLLSELAASV
jgi:glycerate 2-kinase